MEKNNGPAKMMEFAATMRDDPLGAVVVVRSAPVVGVGPPPLPIIVVPDGVWEGADWHVAVARALEKAEASPLASSAPGSV
jgi:hypothetical protein